MPIHLIDEANKCLKEHGLSVQLGIDQTDKFRLNNYGLQYDSSDQVRAIFQLVEGGKIVLQHSAWAMLLSLVEDEFGCRFMRETGLDKLVFPKRRDDD